MRGGLAGSPYGVELAQRLPGELGMKYGTGARPPGFGRSACPLGQVTKSPQTSGTGPLP